MIFNVNAQNPLDVWVGATNDNSADTKVVSQKRVIYSKMLLKWNIYFPKRTHWDFRLEILPKAANTGPYRACLKSHRQTVIKMQSIAAVLNAGLYQC